MRIGFYNQMFALNGRNPLSNLLGHYIIHFQNNKKKILCETDISRTIHTISKVNADIMGIAEILEGQEKTLTEKLRRRGYKYFYFGEGHKTKFHKLRVKILIASKIKCKQRLIKNFPLKNELGGGGGIVQIYNPKLRLDILCVHLANKKKKIYPNQIQFLQKLVKNKKKFILMGDFNLSYKKLRFYFPNLKLISCEEKTCSTTPFFKFFSYKDLDHLFVKNVGLKNFGCIEGYSDHKLIYADLF